MPPSPRSGEGSSPIARRMTNTSLESGRTQSPPARRTGSMSFACQPGTTALFASACSHAALKRAKGAADFRAWREWNESRREESREEGCKESRREEAGEEGSPRQGQEGTGSQERN